MVGVEFLDHCGDVVHSLPDSRVVALLKPLHLVAETPDQNSRMVLVGLDEAADPGFLCRHLLGIVVVESMTFMAEPDTNRNGKTQGMSLIE